MIIAKAPRLGESLDSLEITEWFVKSGDYVTMDDIIGSADSDKASVDLPAEASGIITLLVEPSEIPVGTDMYSIDTSVKSPIKEEEVEETIEDLIVDIDTLIPPTQKTYKEVYFLENGKIRRDWISDGKFLFTEGSDIVYDTSIEVRKHINELITKCLK